MLKLVDEAKIRLSENMTKKLLSTLLFLQLNEFHTCVDFFKYNRIQKAKFRHAHAVPDIAIYLHQLTVNQRNFIDIDSLQHNSCRCV